MMLQDAPEKPSAVISCQQHDLFLPLNTTLLHLRLPASLACLPLLAGMMLQDAPEYPQRRTLISCQHIGTYAFKGCGALDMVAFTTDAPHQQLPIGFSARSSGKGVLLLPKEGPVIGLQDCPILLPQVLPALQRAWSAVAKKAAPVEHARVLRKQVTSPSFDMFRLPPDMRRMEAGLGSGSSSFRRRSLSLVRSSLGSLQAVGSSTPLPSSLGGSGAMVQRQSYLYRGSLPAGSGALASLGNSKAADGLRSLAENLQQLLQVRGGSAGGSQRGSRAGSKPVTPDVSTHHAHSAPLPSVDAAVAAAAAAGGGNSQRGSLAQQQQQQQDVELADQVLLQQLMLVGEPAGAADAAATAGAARPAAVRANGSDRGLSQGGGVSASAKQQQQQVAAGGVGRTDAAAAHDVSSQ
jgi:hypothetical protein